MADQNLKIKISAVDKTAAAFQKVSGGLKSISGKILNLRTGLAALAASAGLVKFSEEIDNLAKQSKLLGLTVNELQRLEFAASQTGATSQELNKGLERFSRNISEAKDGIGMGVRSFEALGIQVVKSDGSLRSTTELLEETADRLKGIEDPAQRVRIGFDLFGRSGVSLVNTLMEGSKGLRQLGDEFDSVTMQLTGEQAEAVEEANDLFDKLGRTLFSMGQQITATLLPILANLSRFIVINVLKALNIATESIRDFMNEFVTMSNELFGTELDEFTFGEQLNKDLERIIFNFENAHNGIEMLENGTRRITITQGEFAEKTNEAKDAIRDMGSKVNTLEDDLKDAGSRGFGRIGDAMADIITQTTSVKDAFRSLANSVINDLARIYTQRFISEPLMAAFSSAFAAPTPTPNPHTRAMGGHVAANRPYMVGERGPELMIPGASGTIIPNNKMGGNGTVVKKTINVSTGVSQTVRAEIMQLMPQISEGTKAAVLDARRRGGSFASAF
jgi:uncharacterized protein YukE